LATCRDRVARADIEDRCFHFVTQLCLWIENIGKYPMKMTKLSKNLAAQISAHQKVEQRVVVLVKTAEATHTEHRKAKVAYKVAKKTARSAKLAWHRARTLAREGQSMLKKSTKRLAKVRSQSSSKE
jgi:exonuclease VII small subunit